MDFCSKKIDMHVHCIPRRDVPKLSGRYYVTPNELRKIYDENGIEKGVVMPFGASPECATDRLSMREAKALTDDHPDTLGWWFCGIDPRMGKNSPETDFRHFLIYYRSQGAKGVGEWTASLPLDDPMVLNLMACCEETGMIVTPHLGGPEHDYGLIDDLHLPRFESLLRSFPRLTVMGHSARFWSELGDDVTCDTRATFIQGRIIREGRIARLMRKYPNLYCDLSSISGYKAMTRDVNYTYSFLEEFHERIVFATDISEKEHGNSDMMRLSSFLDNAAESGRISPETYRAVCRGNALRLLEGVEE